MVIKNCHNPYFSRWFSAIEEDKQKMAEGTSHNPYFSRWFSAIKQEIIEKEDKNSHNPYFSRWFSAINSNGMDGVIPLKSQSLF